MSKLRSAAGFTILEILVVVFVIAVLASVAVPGIARTVSGVRLVGDARSLANAVATAKIRAASKFTRVRLFANVVDDTYHLEVFDKDLDEWVLEGGTSSLSAGVSFGAASVATPPPNSQAAIGDTPKCMTNPPGPVEIGNTLCVIFNSRGIPIDDTGAANADAVLYLQDDTAVYGVAIAATGMTRLWRTYLASDDLWVME